MRWHSASDWCQVSECGRFSVAKIAIGPLKYPPRGAKGDGLIAWRFEAYRRLEPTKRFLGSFASAVDAKRHCSNVAARKGEPEAAKIKAGERRGAW